MNVNVAVNKSYSSLRLLDQLSQDFKGAVDLAVKENGLRAPFWHHGLSDIRTLARSVRRYDADTQSGYLPSRLFVAGVWHCWH